MFEAFYTNHKALQRGVRVYSSKTDCNLIEDIIIYQSVKKYPQNSVELCNFMYDEILLTAIIQNKSKPNIIAIT